MTSNLYKTKIKIYISIISLFIIAFCFCSCKQNVKEAFIENSFKIDHMINLPAINYLCSNNNYYIAKEEDKSKTSVDILIYDLFFNKVNNFNVEINNNIIRTTENELLMFKDKYIENSQNPIKIIEKYDINGQILHSSEIKNIKNNDNFYIFNCFEKNDFLYLITDKGFKTLNKNFEIINETEYNIQNSCIINNNKDISESVIIYTKNNGAFCIAKINNDNLSIVWDIEYGWISGVSSLVFLPAEEWIILLDRMQIKAIDVNTGEYLGVLCNISNEIDYNIEKACLGLDNEKKLIFYTIPIDINQNESIVYSINKMSSDEYNNYIYKKEKEKDNITIKVYMDVKPDHYDEYEAEYKRKTNINIISDVFSDMPYLTDPSRDDFIQKLNASFLSGTADWDILLVRNFDYCKYTDKNIFYDMYSLEKGSDLKNDDKYYTNIFDSCSSKTNGKLYIYPSDITLSLVLGKNNLIKKYIPNIDFNSWKWEDVINKIYPNLDENITVFEKSIISSKEEETIKSIIQREAMGVIENYIVLKKNKTDVINYIKKYITTIESLNNDNIYNKNGNDEIFISDTSLSLFTLFVQSIENKNIILVPAPSMEDNKSNFIFYVYESYLIMEKSSVKEEAFEYIRFLAEECGNIKTSPCKEVNKRTIEDLKKQNIGYYFNENLYNSYLKFLEKADNHYTLLSNIYSHLYQTTEKYLEGLLDLDKASESIYDKFWIYYNE